MTSMGFECIPLEGSAPLETVRADGNLTVLQPELASPAAPGIAGYRLDELQIQNFGTYDGPASVIRFERGNAIFTGRNGVGKTTAIDAFRMLISQDPSFNDATTPEARKRDRDIRTYYQGVLGKVQREGRSEYRVLRQYEEQKFMAVLGIFADAYGNTLSAARLVRYDAQGQGNSQRYLIAPDRLSIEHDFPEFLTGRQFRERLADRKVRIYETFNAYHTALSDHFGITDLKQSWALFERAIGTKTVDNLTDFMRALILPASVLTETADQLVLATVALDEAYKAVKADEEKIRRLVRIVREIDELGGSYRRTTESQRLEKYWKPAGRFVVARAIRRDLVGRRAKQDEVGRAHKTVAEQVVALAGHVTNLQLQESELGGQAVLGWRRDIEDRKRTIGEIRAELKRLVAALHSFGLSEGISFEDSHHNADQWEGIKTDLLKKANAIPERTKEQDRELQSLSAAIAGLESDIKIRQTDLAAAERAKSNLPARLIEVREHLAETLGVSATMLPFFGELVRVSSQAAREGWEGALNRLLGNQARRLLVAEQFYAEAARSIDRRYLGIKMEYDRIDLIPTPQAAHGPDQAAGKLDIRQDSVFAGYVRTVLDKRYDHICFETAEAGFRHARRALTKAGQSRDGNRHVKDDRQTIHDRSAFMLGWDTAERVAYLNRTLRKLEDELRKFNDNRAAIRISRDGLMIRAKNMENLAEGMAEFDRVNHARLEEEILERDQWIERATSQNKDYVAIEKALKEARTDHEKAQQAADRLNGEMAVLEDGIGKQQRRMDRLVSQIDEVRVPYSIWKGYMRLARKVDSQATIFKVDPDGADVLSDGVWEHIRIKIDSDLKKESEKREKLSATLTRLVGEYLREFPAESSFLAIESLTDEGASGNREDWRRRHKDIEGRELVRHRERFQRTMTDAIDTGIVNIRTQVDKEKTEIRDTIAGINDTLRAVTYDPAHGTKIRFIAHDSISKRITEFTRELRQVTDDWIGNSDMPIEERYKKTRIFIDKVKDTPENAAWRRQVLDTRRWFTFIAQEYKPHTDGSEEIVNDYDGASGSSGGQKERLAMTVMAAGLAWRFGMVAPARAASSFRILMLDEAFKNSHDDTTRALLDLFKAFGFQMIFAMPSKNLAVVSNHIAHAFAVDTKARRTIITVHVLRDLVIRNQASAAATALRMAREAGVDISNLDFSEIDEDRTGLAGLTADEIIALAEQFEASERATS